MKPDKESKRRDYFLAFDNRPLNALLKYIKHSEEKASDVEIEFEQRRYKEELQKLIDSKSCCKKMYRFLEFKGILFYAIVNSTNFYK